MPLELIDELSNLLKSEDAQELHRRETATEGMLRSAPGEREELWRSEVLEIESYERMKKQKLQVITDARSQVKIDGADRSLPSLECFPTLSTTERSSDVTIRGAQHRHSV